MGYYCTVPQCTSLAGKTKNVKFHRFPRDCALADKWNEILKRGKPYTKYSKVCSLHFSDRDYSMTTMGKNKGFWKSLNKDAVPTRNLPECNPDGTLVVKRKVRVYKVKTDKQEHNHLAEGKTLSEVKTEIITCDVDVVKPPWFDGNSDIQSVLKENSSQVESHNAKSKENPLVRLHEPALPQNLSTTNINSKASVFNDHASTTSANASTISSKVLHSAIPLNQFDYLSPNKEVIINNQVTTTQTLATRTLNLPKMVSLPSMLNTPQINAPPQFVLKRMQDANVQTDPESAADHMVQDFDGYVQETEKLMGSPLSSQDSHISAAETSSPLMCDDIFSNQMGQQCNELIKSEIGDNISQLNKHQIEQHVSQMDKQIQRLMEQQMERQMEEQADQQIEQQIRQMERFEQHSHSILQKQQQFENGILKEDNFFTETPLKIKDEPCNEIGTNQLHVDIDSQPQMDEANFYADTSSEMKCESNTNVADQTVQSELAYSFLNNQVLNAVDTSALQSFVSEQDQQLNEIQTQQICQTLPVSPAYPQSQFLTQTVNLLGPEQLIAKQNALAGLWTSSLKKPFFYGDVGQLNGMQNNIFMYSKYEDIVRSLNQ